MYRRPSGRTIWRRGDFDSGSKRIKTHHTKDDERPGTKRASTSAASARSPSKVRRFGALLLIRKGPAKMPSPHTNFEIPTDPYEQRHWFRDFINDLVTHLVYGNAPGDAEAPARGPATPDTASTDRASLQRFADSDSFGQALRSSGRKRKWTSKVRDANLGDQTSPDPGDTSQQEPEQNGQPAAPAAAAPSLKEVLEINEIRVSLLSQPGYHPEFLVRRHQFGVLALESMASKEEDPMPAARVNDAVHTWRERDILLSALETLARCEPVRLALNAISNAERGNDQTASKPKHPPVRPKAVKLFFGMRVETPEHVEQPSTDADVASRAPSRPSPEAEPPVIKRGRSDARVLDKKKASLETVVAVPEPVDPDENFEEDYLEMPAVNQAPLLDPEQSRRETIAIRSAYSVLHDMAFGGLKNMYNNAKGNKYVTPYGPPILSNQKSGLRTSLPSSSRSKKGKKLGTPQNSQEDLRGVKGSLSTKKSSQSMLPPGKGISNSPEMTSPGDMDKSTLSAGKIASYDVTEEQLDSFLALANGGALMSDDEDDSDQEAEATRFRPQGDPSDVESLHQYTTQPDSTLPRPGSGKEKQTTLDFSIESVINGIIAELRTGQNWGHGLGFLNPQAHLHQIQNADRFASDLREYIDQSRLRANYIVSSEQGEAQSALYEALVKRIKNPYLEGEKPEFSNIVYHKGKPCYAIPGPAHPMYQQGNMSFSAQSPQDLQQVGNEALTREIRQEPPRESAPLPPPAQARTAVTKRQEPGSRRGDREARHAPTSPKNSANKRSVEVQAMSPSRSDIVQSSIYNRHSEPPPPNPSRQSLPGSMTATLPPPSPVSHPSLPSTPRHGLSQPLPPMQTVPPSQPLPPPPPFPSGPPPSLHTPVSPFMSMQPPFTQPLPLLPQMRPLQPTQPAHQMPPMHQIPPFPPAGPYGQGPPPLPMHHAPPASPWYSPNEPPPPQYYDARRDGNGNMIQAQLNFPPILPNPSPTSRPEQANGRHRAIAARTPSFKLPVIPPIGLKRKRKRHQSNGV